MCPLSPILIYLDFPIMPPRFIRLRTSTAFPRQHRNGGHSKVSKLDGINRLQTLGGRWTYIAAIHKSG
jgi:hypothetical protein